MLRYYRNGREIRESLGTRDEAQAITKARALMSGPAMLASGDYEDEIEKYFAAKRKADRLSRQSIICRERTLLRFFEQSGRVRVAAITARDAQAYYDSLPHLTEESRQTYVGHLQSFYKWLVEQRRVRENPFAALKMARVRPTARKHTLTKEQVNRLLSACTDPLLTFVLYCGFHAGMRKEEVIEARPEWFDLTTGHIHIGPTATWIPKDRERRSVPLSKAFATFLRGYGMPGPYMIAPTVKRGTARYRFDFRKRWLAHLKVCGIRCTFHDARRTFASLLVSSGVSVYKVARWLGDGVAVVEKHYGHLQISEGELDKVFGA